MPLFTYSFSPSICELKKKHLAKKTIKRSHTPIKKKVTRKTISRRPRTISRRPRTISRHPRTISRRPKTISRKLATPVKTSIQRNYYSKKLSTDNESSDVIDVQPGKPKYVSETKHETWVCGYDDGVCKLVNREYTRGGDSSIKFPDTIEKKDDTFKPRELLQSLKSNPIKTIPQSKVTSNGYPLINANKVKLLDLAKGVDGFTYCAIATSNNSKKWEKCGRSTTQGCDC
jgi:hypothetical protein